MKKSIDILKSFFTSLYSDENSENFPQERLNIYKSLIFNNIEDTCAKAFPITKHILNENWNNLIKNFIKEENLSSPYLQDVPFEFFNFCKNFEGLEDFITELMFYELIELEVFNKDIPLVKANFSWNYVYRLSETAILKEFSYPVHKLNEIGIENLKRLKGNFPLIIYLNPKNFDVEYLEITKFLFEILEKINEDSLKNIVNTVCSKNKISFEEVKPPLEKFFKLLIDRKIIV